MISRDTKIIIIGGSIAGCASAILASRAGADVTILERSTSETLAGRGAGITMPESIVKKYIELDLFDKDIARLRVNSRPFFTKDKKQIWQQDFNGVVVLNWSDVYSNIRKRTLKVNFQKGQEVNSINQTENDCVVKTTSGREFKSDYVIAADGVDSVIRKQLFPQQSPQFAGYVAWRGTFVLPSSDTLFDETMPCYVFPNGHALLYSIPMGNQTSSGKLINWLIYEVCDNETLKNRLLDKHGKQHTTSLPPNSLTESNKAHLSTLAKAVLPANIAEMICNTEAPFLQAIMDFQIPQFANGRTLVIGDAAVTLRPHSGSGILKALNDGVGLVAALLDNSLKDWNESLRINAEQQIALAKSLGHALVVNTPQWEEMDTAAMEKWWKSINNTQGWYATTAQLSLHRNSHWQAEAKEHSTANVEKSDNSLKNN